MPCLVLTGHPCVGKTTFAQLLKERALQHKSGLISQVAIVNEESVCVDQTKAECYATSHAEKSTRAAIKAEVDRQLSPQTKKNKLVIVDSLNYIKGYRYELHCLTKAVQDKHGVIWILNSVALAKENNSVRRRERPDYSYSDQTMEELIQRFEPPDARNRWDKPLYRIDLTPNSSTTTTTTDTDTACCSNNSTNQAAEDALQRSVYNMHSLSDAIQGAAAAAPPTVPSKRSGALTFQRGARFHRAGNVTRTEADTDTPNPSNDPQHPVSIDTTPVSPNKANQSLEERIDEILDSFLLNVQPLKEGTSTQQAVTANANVLHLVDTITQKVCHQIVEAQRLAIPGVNNLSIGGNDGILMDYRRKIPLVELTRLRKQYVRWIANHPPDVVSERGIAESFVRYMEAQIN